FHITISTMYVSFYIHQIHLSRHKAQLEELMQAVLLPKEVTIESGYEDKNAWLDWINYTANSAGVTNCFACSSATLTLFNTPALLLPDLDPLGFHCILAIHMTPNPTNCSALSFLFPLTSNTTTLPTNLPWVTLPGANSPRQHSS
uniref:Uncharacterized protein n=1 Tax=Mola mola TaxID=94237 RepID=A0A3Q3VY36_MOLML